MDAKPISGRKSTQTLREKKQSIAKAKKQIFGDHVEFNMSQPKVEMNGKSVKAEDIKAIKPKADIENAFTKAAKLIDAKEDKELEQLVNHEDINAVIRDFEKFKKIHPNVQIPKYDPKSPGELERLKTLFKLAIKENTSGSVIFYKQALLISMVLIQIAVCKFTSIDIEGLFDMHLQNMRLYDKSFMEMTVQSGGKGFYESLSPGYQLAITVFSSTALFCLMKWAGSSKEHAIGATTSITGYMGSTEELPMKNDGGWGDMLMGLAPVATKMMGGVSPPPQPLNNEKSPPKKDGKKKKISLPVQISKD